MSETPRFKRDTVIEVTRACQVGKFRPNAGERWLIGAVTERQGEMQYRLLRPRKSGTPHIELAPVEDIDDLADDGTIVYINGRP